MIFEDRHIGTSSAEKAEMLKAVGVKDIDELVNLTIPSQIRLKQALNLAPAMTEHEYLDHIQSVGSKNKVYNNFIGQGYYGTLVPPVNLRNIFENPGWYTAYTPYQAEISQGRLEALLNFQTMVMELTAMEMANASLLDEGTAAAEAMIMFYNARSRDQKKNDVKKFFVSSSCFAQTIDVIEGRAKNMDIELVVDAPENFVPSAEYFGAIVQFPDKFGKVESLGDFIAKSHQHEVKVGVAADLMSLVVLEAPGQVGADAVFGNTQRFGVPMGFGGPHAAYFATKEEYKRNLPGRIIGISVDADGNYALRMALQTREQHIKRDKATSNICTAQALLAVMAGMYVVYHGPKALKEISVDIHQKAIYVEKKLSEMGLVSLNGQYYDTVHFELPAGRTVEQMQQKSSDYELNINYFDGSFSISFDESHTKAQIHNLLSFFADVTGKSAPSLDAVNWSGEKCPLPSALHRSDKILQHDVFNTHHSETKMMRYLKSLENKDLSLVHSMISLGSCTMKLNAAAELMPLSWPEFSNIHPFAPKDQWTGYQEIMDGLSADLCEITGFAGMSLQPNSGAQGEYAGLMVIKAYHEANGDHHRDICLIPSSAHGTNPASAVMAGMKVVVTACDENGNIDVEDLKAKAVEHKDNLAALMVTYPSTHGVYEEAIMEITSIIHDNGGQVYMDGANMNAQVGLTNPGNIGADVCHLNLHKTFAIPHGGGGPGMGPIGVAKHLVPFLPGSPMVDGIGGDKAINAISAAPYGSGLILLISYAYIKMLGAHGLKAATENAILNANYLRVKLKDHFPILYTGTNGTVAHEMIVDCRDFKRTAGVEVADIAKRLIDYNFHAPTVSFPVAGTLMIEPTESEDKAELDRFIEALISIRNEITEIETQGLDQENNVLKNSPHTALVVTANDWNYSYSREKAAYPLAYLKSNKYWVPVRRVDNAHGDRNLICSCTPIEAYLETV
ncbi:aminomethyl-transferring glycine dehydrogenase [Paracrocinitomix mangrovi]|uniref:aminomethyl-transferring glycine dehydrogenase n=1 Tax=Paracrocinitomix mangrovi TaxID=2862509 RepID=UPI001C8E3027|nr:aminomethyl-transferring glycine dehydrogenase [Paracrocinitomix mangrovi]UKN00406.1 aminomethyl-transferring glycine dehydrogenase [Paracrocinitomix mangrovi]